jgi:hypothetical protein
MLFKGFWTDAKSRYIRRQRNLNDIACLSIRAAETPGNSGGGVVAPQWA